MHYILIMLYSFTAKEMTVAMTNYEDLPTAFKSVQSHSLLHCAIMCLHDLACGGICFNHQSRRCYKLMANDLDLNAHTWTSFDTCTRYSQPLNFQHDAPQGKLY